MQLTVYLGLKTYKILTKQISQKWFSKGTVSLGTRNNKTGYLKIALSYLSIFILTRKSGVSKIKIHSFPATCE